MRQAATFTLLALLIASCSLLSGVCRADLADAGRTVYKVGVSQTDGGTAVGSAVLVAPGKLVTSCHTIRSARRIQIVHPQGELAATAGKTDLRHDLCLLLVQELRAPIAERAPTASLRTAQPIVAIGFGRGFRPSVLNGEVTGLFPFEGGNVVRISSAFPRGASGGGLFDEEGRLVGILTFRGSADDELNYAVPTEWLDSLLAADAAAMADHAVRTAFWEDDATDPPAFLKFNWLLHARRYDELVGFAVNWTLAEPENSEAWLALGRAQLEVGRDKEAALALHQAATLAPASGDAWYWFAVACQRSGLPIAFIEADHRLSVVDPNRSARLRGKIGLGPP